MLQIYWSVRFSFFILQWCQNFVCVFNESPPNITMTLDEQCEQATGEIGAIAMGSITQICGRMKCRTPSGLIHTFGNSALDFTTCGPRKVDMWLPKQLIQGFCAINTRSAVLSTLALKLFPSAKISPKQIICLFVVVV